MNVPEGFPCTKCGACCRSEALRVIGLPTKSDGSCMFLLANNTCSCYNSRPTICRIDKMNPEIAESDLKRLIVYRRTADECNRLQEKLGIDKSYRVVIREVTEDRA